MTAEQDVFYARSTGSFLGYARIELERLDFSSALRKEHREESKKARARLLKVFELEGCRRLDPQNFIDATINQETFVAALNDAGLSRDNFDKICVAARTDPSCIIQLSLKCAIQCLNGLQRIRAAATFLDNNDKWWIVNLHEETKLQSHLQVHLYESYRHEQEYTDGTIFRNILKYSKSQDDKNEQKWWARLTPTKRKDLKQLLTARNRKLSNAFNDLTAISGFWPPLQLGTLHRFHGLKCNEILINYLRHIRAVWTKLVPARHWHQVDCQTVTFLELLAPGVSTRDRKHLKEAMLNGTLFPSLGDNIMRAEILQSILAYKGLIPSIRTFFENQKYLEPCSNILKDLLGFSSKRSLWKEYKANHFPTDQVRIQSHEGMQSFQDVNIPSTGLSIKARRKFAFLQLCMFCLRNFPEMTSIGTRLEARSRVDHQSRELKPKALATSKQRPNDPALWHKLARLARELGFDTERIRYLADQDPEEMQTLQFLASARPNWKGDMTDHIAKVRDILKGMCEQDPGYLSVPSFMGDTCVTWPKDRRCGRPHDSDHEKDKSALFATMFYFPILPGNEITSLFVKRETLYAFFGTYISSIQPDWISLTRSRGSRCSELPTGQPRSLPQSSVQTRLKQLELDIQAKDATILHLENLMHEQGARFATKESEYGEELRNLRTTNERLGSSNQQPIVAELCISQVESDVMHQQEIDRLAKSVREVTEKYNASRKSLRKLQDDLSKNGEDNAAITSLKKNLEDAKEKITKLEKSESLIIKNRHNNWDFHTSRFILNPDIKDTIKQWDKSQFVPNMKNTFKQWDDYWLDYDTTHIFEHTTGVSEDLYVQLISVGEGRIYSTRVKIPRNKEEVERFLEYLRSQTIIEPGNALHLIIGRGMTMSYRRITSSNEDTQSLLRLNGFNTSVFYSHTDHFPVFFDRYKRIHAARSTKRGGESIEENNRRGRIRVDHPDDDMDTSSEL